MRVDTITLVSVFFDEDGTTHEFTDIIDRVKLAPIGSHVAVVYPEGRPTLARVPRPLVRAVIYLLAFCFAGLLGVKALELIVA